MATAYNESRRGTMYSLNTTNEPTISDQVVAYETYTGTNDMDYVADFLEDYFPNELPN